VTDLKWRWCKLFKEHHHLSVEKQALIEKGFKNLIQHYAEKHRYYHTIEHIKTSLNLFDKVKNNLTDPTSIEIALWFHDVIYIPRKNNNEEKSAELAISFLQALGFDQYRIQKIETLILLTKHPSKPNSKDEKFLIDIDLSVLGTTTEHYHHYELCIRKEYRFVPDYLYKKGRSKLLNSFLSLNTIYQTDYFRNNFEVQARNNLIYALSQL